MKFLLDFVSCCCAAVGPPEPTTRQRREETRSCAASDLLPRRKRGKLTGSVLEAQWRPSLCSISEDNVVSIVAGMAERSSVKSEKKLPEKARAKATTRVRNDSNEFRPAPVPVVIPAFSPTSFLF